MTSHGVHGGKEPGMDTALLDVVSAAPRSPERVSDAVVPAYYDRVEIE
jgi:hypothetical protein